MWIPTLPFLFHFGEPPLSSRSVPHLLRTVFLCCGLTGNCPWIPFRSVKILRISPISSPCLGAASLRVGQVPTFDGTFLPSHLPSVLPPARRSRTSKTDAWSLSGRNTKWTRPLLKLAVLLLPAGTLHSVAHGAEWALPSSSMVN